jgi:antitoxin CptB
MKENDILLGRFADRYIQKLNDQQLDDLEVLMKQSDIDIMNWVIGKTAVPEEFNTELILLIQSFNKSQ